MEESMESLCADLRKYIEETKGEVADLFKSSCFKDENMNLQGAAVPPDQHGNMRANITLAFRHLEDARMRLGKVMQACQGGVSILDK